MEKMGLPQLCAECGQQANGGCCFSDMTDEADGLLFLINHLAEHPSEQVRILESMTAHCLYQYLKVERLVGDCLRRYELLT